MIERLLAADAALDDGDLEAAERLYHQISAADPHNAIALVGLARIAHRRGDEDDARSLAVRALAIDPDEAAATRLLAALTPEAATPPASSPRPIVASRPSALARLRARLRSLLGRRA
jgi:predicted Zn-dependent protease